MQNIFEIILFAEPDFSEFIREGTCGDRSIQIRGMAFCLSDLEKLVTSNKHAIVVIEIKHSQLGSPSLKNIEHYLVSHEVIFLAVCDNVQDGFIALQNGATTMLVRPKSTAEPDILSFFNSLKTKIRTIHKQNELDRTRILKQDLGLTFNKLIAIGSSTGGTETTLQILKGLPANSPPILIVQHMPPVFSKLYADRINKECKMTIWEAKDGDLIRPGLVLIAPGDYHMTVTKTGGNYAVKCEKGEKVNGHCPSVDMLFHSVARVAGNHAVGVILTGMGADGAKGLLDMKQHGAVTLGQDEESCVVYGMPKAAYDMGAVVKQVSLNEMASAIMESASGH